MQAEQCGKGRVVYLEQTYQGQAGQTVSKFYRLGSARLGRAGYN